MKLLVLNHGGLNAQDRQQALVDLGHDVTAERLYPSSDGLLTQSLYKWAIHMKSGPWVEMASRDLQARARSWRDFDLVWIEKAQYLRSETIEFIKGQAACPIVHYTPDVHIKIKGTQHSPIFHYAIPSYDAVITTKAFEIESYRQKGAKKIIYMEQAIDHRRFAPCEKVDAKYRSQIGFIGHFEPYYAGVIGHLVDQGFNVDVRGSGWDKRRIRLNPRYRKLRSGRAARGREYIQRLNGMKIGLGLLRKSTGDVMTTRSLEIPACGTFLLAERTEKHREMFQEGIEAEFFDNRQELVEKAYYYLSNPQARERIARAGHQRFLHSSYRLDRQLKKIMDQLVSQMDLAGNGG